MQIDTFLKIGKSHKICEDYILSGTNPMPYIILADGCSSSKGTDMGARLLCHLARQYIKFRTKFPNSDIFHPDHKEMGMWIIHNAELAAKQLGLSNTALDATLIVAYKQFEKNYVRVHFYGDGCVIHFGKKDMAFTEIEYTKNAPYYLSYSIDPHRDDLFHKMGQDKIVKTYVSSQSLVSCEDKFAYDSASVYNYQLDEEFDGLIIASDGMVSFVEDGQGLVSPTKYINSFYTFKTTKGEFLQRRVNKLLKDLAQENIYNADDLSVGAFLKEG